MGDCGEGGKNRKLARDSLTALFTVGFLDRALVTGIALDLI